MADVVVIGAGIFGLSIAYALKRAGASVEVVDAGQVGGGASGGVVGALCPHAPTRWRPFKQFQFDALRTLSDRVAELGAETGRSVGYARTGRITPLQTSRDRTRAEAELTAAAQIWGNVADFRILDTVPLRWAHWVAPEAATAGLVHETLSARLDPRAYITALADFVGPIRTGCRVVGLNRSGHGIETDLGPLHADRIVVAAGWQSWDLIDPMVPGLRGQPVKGQAAVLGCDAGDVPLLYNDGLYAIPHGKGRIAIGSTSEKQFKDPGTDEQLEIVIDKARQVVPCLSDAPVVERWSGLRPKPPGREPVVGPLPGRTDVWLATGGFKISFGIAHAIGDAVAAGLVGNEASIALPDTFDLGHLLARP